MQSVENPTLKEEVKKNSALKTWLVDYVGANVRPKDGLVTVEMIIDVMSKEFPEFLLALAEENFIRGYEQALADVESEEQTGKKRKKRK
jgi:hypothetical protein